MTKKAYIVTNKQQEREVLRELEKKGNEWNDKRNATDFIPSEKLYVKFPYAIMSDRFIGWLSIDDAIVENYEIVYDGRKEEQMSDKYVVSQEFMNELNYWKKVEINNRTLEVINAVFYLDDYKFIYAWLSKKEVNNRLIAIIRWVNGEDVFEVEKPKKWVVRSKEHNNFGEYTYVTTDEIFILAITMGVANATRFDTKEEAESWANSHQEVIEVEE